MDILSEELLFKKSSQEITAILYDRLLGCLEESMHSIRQKDFCRANLLLQQGNDILHRLGAGLRYDGNPIAENLDHLYNFAADELIEANLYKDTNKIEIVITIIEALASAWNTALNNKEKLSANHVFNKVSQYEKNILRMNQ